MNKPEQMVIAPEDVVKVRFLGVGSPTEIRAKQEERIKQVRHHKNKKAEWAKERVNSVLRKAGIPTRAPQELRQRTPKPKKPQNYRWSPESGS